MGPTLKSLRATSADTIRLSKSERTRSGTRMKKLRQRIHSLHSPKKESLFCRNDMKQCKYSKYLQKSKRQHHGNGIIGVYIEKKYCMRAWSFWNQYVSLASDDKFKRIATMMFSYLMVALSTNGSNDAIKSLMGGGMMEYNQMMEAPLHMIGTLLRLLMKDDINAFNVLSDIGTLHSNSYNVSSQSYNAMLNAMHVVFVQLFTKAYSVQIRYAFDVVFMSSVRIMIGQLQFDKCTVLAHKLTALNELLFLKSLSICLSDDVGREYLYHYLVNTYCNEMVLFLKKYEQFRECNPLNRKLRYKLAIKIYNECISDSCEFQINCPFATYQRINALVDAAAKNEDVQIPNDIYDDAYQQMIRLIQQNHWISFRKLMRCMLVNN